MKASLLEKISLKNNSTLFIAAVIVIFICGCDISLDPTGNGKVPPFIKFNPPTTSVSATKGESVTWTNNDTDRVHNVTFVAPSGAVKATLFPKNSGKPNTFTWTPSATLPKLPPGNIGDIGSTYAYTCTLHGETGSITVK